MNDIPEFPGPGKFQVIDDPQAEPPSQPRILFDDRKAELTYANMIRMHSSPEEFAVDLAYLPNPAAQQNVAVAVTHRVVLSPFNAKRLLGMLAQGVKRYEEQFGSIELDVRKRSQGSPE